MKKILCILALMLALASCRDGYTLSSPNGRVKVDVKGQNFSVSYDGVPVVTDGYFGLLGSGAEISQESVAKVKYMAAEPEDETYEMAAGKRRVCRSHCNKGRIEYIDKGGNRAWVDLRVFDDGLAFGYFADGDTIFEDCTVLPIDGSVKSWRQPYRPDSYEDFYDPALAGEPGVWGVPALFEINDSIYMLVSESDAVGYSAVSHLDNSENPAQYRVKLAGPSHAVDCVKARTPWRTLIIGSLADVVESTMVTNLSMPAVIDDTSWIEPGPVAWVYWAYNHGSNDYQIVKRYVDLAVEMGWPYVLIDAEWDEMGNGGTVEDAVAYACSRGVKPMLWYNSSVGWIDGAPGPKFRLNDPEKRRAEFAWLKSIGVTGVKIDFFDGDSQEMMQYYQDLLASALAQKLMVTLHGATVPRGWQRAYPNLMTVEGVYGAEWYNNKPVLTGKAAAHNATLPFTRNVIGPMDYTPGTFTDSQHPHITTHAHELALTVLFESALQHMPDRPEAYLSLPQDVKSLLSNLPTAWDDTKLLAGYPGEYVVLARQKGDAWYVAGINGADEDKTLIADLTRLGLPADTQCELFADGEGPRSFAPAAVFALEGDTLSVKAQPRGGFVAVLRPNGEKINN